MVFGSPIVEVIDGNPVEFPKLFICDYESLFESQRALRKAKIERAVKEGLLSKEDSRQMMLALADGPENIFEIQNSHSDPRMMRAILEKSWKKTGRMMSELEEIIAKQDPELLATIAYKVTRREPEKKKADPLDPKDRPAEGAGSP
jgi:hypothetical protein